MTAATAARGTSLLDPFFSMAATLGERDALTVLEQCRRRCDALEAALLAGRVGAGDEGGAKRLLRLAGVSKRDSGRRIERAKVVDANPTVGARLAEGVVSGEQIDAIAAADRHSGGAASADAGFVEDVLASSPDAGPALRKQWLNARLSKVDVEEKHRRQRAARDIWRHRTDDGLSAITMAGDDATMDGAWARIGVVANQHYETDGGRDVSGEDHRRSYAQRLFDAAIQSINGRAGSRSGRPSVVITIDAAALLDPDGDGSFAHQIGTGPVADAVVIDALKDADLWTLVMAPSGQPLWCGRSSRNASKAQLIAMICRDRGCVETGEHWTRSQAHHVVGWNAAARGRSDVDQMVLVSETVHRDLHSTNETFEYDPAIGKWRRRKARPSEQSPHHRRRHWPNQATPTKPRRSQGLDP